MNIREYSKKIQHFLAQLDVFFQMNKSKKINLNTEKTSKNPRNSAYQSRWIGIIFKMFKIFFQPKQIWQKSC